MKPAQKFTKYYQDMAAKALRKLGQVPIETNPKWNTVAHVYVAAVTRLHAGEAVARAAGNFRELNTWFRSKGGGYRADPVQRRDTYKDLFNSNIGIKLAGWMASDGVPHR